MNKIKSLKHRFHEIIFEADTPLGKAFDVVLLWSIILSVLVVMLDSVKSLNDKYSELFFIIEWIFTILFSLEYIARLLAVAKPLKYAVSFMGIIDLLAILPTYLSLYVVGSHYLMTVRTMRLLRIFRIFKLSRFLSEANSLWKALTMSLPKLTVFLTAVLSVVIIMGTIMYQIEGQENGFSSIPKSIYWAIVTMTTVGYGDIAPKTILGQFIASIVMILGYGIIAIPTGIVSVEFAKNTQQSKLNTQACHFCAKEGHETDAKFCKYCGGSLT